MTTTNNYVFEFESALDTAKEAKTATELLESLNLSISKTDPQWRQLERLVEGKQIEGYDFNRGRASLALLCQDATDPIESRFKITHYCAYLVEDKNPDKKRLCFRGTIDGKPFYHGEIIHTDLHTALPHVLKSSLKSKSDLFALHELGDLRVTDGTCTKLAKDSYRSQLYFNDYNKGIGWRTTSVASSPLAAICNASLDGYRFGSDPRRELIPQKIVPYRPNVSDPYLERYANYQYDK